MSTTNQFIDILSQVVELKRCDNNHTVYISAQCPFCKYTGRGGKVFRYNMKLRVGKSYCCGASFKDLSWMKRQLVDGFDVTLFQMENKHFIYKNVSEEDISEYKKFKENLSMRESRIEKSLRDDDNLPF